MPNKDALVLTTSSDLISRARSADRALGIGTFRRDETFMVSKYDSGFRHNKAPGRKTPLDVQESLDDISRKVLHEVLWINMETSHVYIR